MPGKADGYVLQTFFTEKGKKEKRMSRRYIKVGSMDTYSFMTCPLLQMLLIINRQCINYFR